MKSSDSASHYASEKAANVLLKPMDRDFCPCGIGKRWHKCHSSVTAPNSIETDPEIDPVLLSLLENVLRTLSSAIPLINIHADNLEKQFRLQCLLYFAKKTYRATLAGVTLIHAGQTTQAFTLKRDQHYSWVCFNYYLLNERESILFVASAPLRQHDEALKLAKIRRDVKDDTKRQSQLTELETLSKMALEKFPDLIRYKGKSENSNNPIRINWQEPNVSVMMEAIIKTWDDQSAEQVQASPDLQGDPPSKGLADNAHFFHSHFPSQELHGTPMGFISEMHSIENGDDDYTDLNLKQHEPNGLLFLYAWYAFGVAARIVELTKTGGFKNRFIKIYKALLAYQNHFEHS